MIRDSPWAIIFRDMKINKKAVEQMREYDVALCIPMGQITSLYGLQRSRALYLTRKLVIHARKMKVDVSTVTLARDMTHMCSCIQLLEMAKLVGLKEEYARESIGRINRSIVER